MLRKRLLPNKGSINDKLSQLDIGERMYFETTLDRYAKDMRLIHAGKKRRPAILEGRSFSTLLFTGVSSGNLGEIRYLICIEREGDRE